jgi:mannosyl-3-phosphoglycerate phosphatase
MPSRPTTAETPGARRRLAVVTDLDGCLLDARTYSFAPARRVLRRLRREGVPLVLCTSKDRAEVRHLFAALGTAHVAVLEDGAAVLLPPGTASRAALPSARRTRDGRMLALAVPHAVVRGAFRSLRRLTRGAAVGFGDLPLRDLAALTGLRPEAARRAARREFDEPFVLARGERRWAPVVRRAARRLGLVVTRGGRFYHLHGPTDKGRAARLARGILEARHGALTVVAFGDSPLDAAFLRDADLPVIVPRQDGRPDPLLRRLVPRARVAPAPGPDGWARALEDVLRECGRLGTRPTRTAPPR